MKKTLIILLVPVLLVSCKKKERDPLPEFILNRWAASTEALSYSDYVKYEAYPKEQQVFREIYSEVYFKNITVLKYSEPDEKEVFRDPAGNSYIKRNISFECVQMKRNSGQKGIDVRGDVDLLKFKDGKRSGDGWLMANRTIIRLK